MRRYSIAGVDLACFNQLVAHLAPFHLSSYASHAYADAATLLANRRHRGRHARKHQQSFTTWRAPRLSARQDGQLGRLRTGFQARRQSGEEAGQLRLSLKPWCCLTDCADVVEGHEDASVHHRWYHPALGCHHCAVGCVLSACPVCSIR